MNRTQIKELLVQNSIDKKFTSVAEEIVADVNLLVDVLFDALFKEGV